MINSIKDKKKEKKKKQEVRVEWCRNPRKSIQIPDFWDVFGGVSDVDGLENARGVTEFTLEAFGWSAEEDGMPLLYDFGYYDAAGASKRARIHLKSDDVE